MSSEQMLAAAALGYVLAWFKAFKRFPTWAMQVATVLLMAAVYAVFVSAPHAGTWRVWLQDVVAWGMAALGVASVANNAGLAPKTDSIH